MIAADAVRIGVFAALPFAPSAGAIVALAFVAGLATGFFRPAVYAGVPNLVPTTQICPRRTRCSRRSRTSAGRSGRSSAACSRRRPGRLLRTAINAVSFVVSIVLVIADPGALAAERARAHAWLLARPRRRLQRGASLAARCGRCSSRGASRSLATGAVNVARDLPRQEHASPPATSATGCSTARWAPASCSAASSARECSRASGVARDLRRRASALMASATSAHAVSPNVWVAAACCVVAGHRQRHGHRLQRAARPARHVRPDARPRADVRDEHDVRARRASATAIGGLLIDRTSPRWIWAACGRTLFVAALAGEAARPQPRRREPPPRTRPGAESRPCRSRPLESARWPAAATGLVRTLPPASATATGVRSHARSRSSRTATRSPTASSPTSTRRPAPRTRSASPGRPASASRASSRR